jgi:hypothetical protein
VWKGESSVETRIIKAIERAHKVNVGIFLRSRKLEETSQIDVDVIYQKKDQIPMEIIMRFNKIKPFWSHPNENN